MCRTQIITRSCASPDCTSPDEPYVEFIKYAICIPTHYDHEDCHVDRMEQDISKITDAERISESKGLCSACEERQQRDPAQYLAWIRNPASKDTSEDDRLANAVHFNDTSPSQSTNLPTKLIQIIPPLPASACPWLCTRLELSSETCSLATQILQAIERGHLDGRHQDPALLGAAVYMASYLLGEKKLKVRDIKNCMKGGRRDQIEAAYALLYGKWESVLRGQVGARVRYRIDEGRLKKPVRGDGAPREHWMM